MPRVTVKTSTIFISVGDKTRVFRSVEDVPAPLRRKLEKSTNGINSATILIADRRGREEIVKAIRGLPSSVKSRLSGTMPEKPRVEDASRWMCILRNSVEWVLPSAIGFAVWFLFSIR